MVVILLLLTILVLLAVDYALRRESVGRTLAVVPVPTTDARPGAEPAAASWLPVPADVFLTPGHSWAHLEPNGLRLGSGELPLRALGGVDRLDLRLPGTRVGTGEPLAVLRRGGREIVLRSPLDCTITAANSRLQANPPLLRRSPYTEGWLYVVRPDDLAASLRTMRIGDDARTWLSQEVGRLRDFLTGLRLRRGQTTPVLADGGLPVEGFGALLDDEAWGELLRRVFDATAQPRGS